MDEKYFRLLDFREQLDLGWKVANDWEDRSLEEVIVEAEAGQALEEEAKIRRESLH